MRKRAISFATASAAAAAGLVLFAAPALAADTGSRNIQQSDNVIIDGEYNGDMGTGSHSFQPDGLHIAAGNGAANRSVFRWADGGPFAAVQHVDYTWTGTVNQVGIKYDIDVTGDGTADCELVGEHANGDTVFLNSDAGDFYDSDDQDYTDCADNGPGTAPISEWVADFPDATVVDVGYGASNPGTSGVLSQVTVGANRYTFAAPAATTTPAPVQTVAAPSRTNVTGRYVTKQRAHKLVIQLIADATPTGSTAGSNLVWTYTVNKGSKHTVSQTAGRTDTVTVKGYSHAKKAGNHKVIRLYKNGDRVAVYSITPRPKHHH